MSNKLYFEIVFAKSEFTANLIREWFDSFLFFTPVQIYGTVTTSGRFRTFSNSLLSKAIDQELRRKGSFSLDVNGEDCSLRCARGHYRARVSGFRFLESNEELVTFAKSIEAFFVKYKGIQAFICPADDHYWQNVTEPNLYRFENKSMEHLHFTRSPIFKNDMIIDVEYNPGHSHYVEDLIFGSFWKMWYGEGFFNYIPKQNLLNVSGCYENVELENGAVHIQLFEDIWEYEKPESREIQWEFRRVAGIEKVAHAILDSYDEPVENPDPEIHILEGEFPHGGVRRVEHYLNWDGRFIPKSNAVECRTYEFDAQGNLVWSEVRKIGS